MLEAAVAGSDGSIGSVDCLDWLGRFGVGWEPGWERAAFFGVVGAQDAAEVGVVFGVAVGVGVGGEEGAEGGVAGGGCCEEAGEV